MNTQQKVGLQEPPSEETVAAFLEHDPEFFTRHPELVARLRIPHACGGAVSLLEHQINVLRGQLGHLRQRLGELVEVARENDRLAERLHRLTLELFHPTDLDDTLHALKDGLRRQFQADLVAVRLIVPAALLAAEQSSPDLVSAEDPGLRPFARFLRDGRPQCGPLAPEQAAYLFGDAAKRLGSAAVVRLRHAAVDGLLAIGSHDRQRFHPSQGTVFLRQLGALAAHSLAPRLVAS